MVDWIWESTDDWFIHRFDDTTVEVFGFDDGSWMWRSYEPSGVIESASGFATADVAKADAERFYTMGDIEEAEERAYQEAHDEIARKMLAIYPTFPIIEYDDDGIIERAVADGREE